jgi:hypothetical protein
MRHVRKRVPAGKTVVENLLRAVGYVKTRLYENSRPHNGYVVSFCDAVFLRPELVTDTLETIAGSDANVVLHYVERAAFEAAELPAERTYIPVADGHYTGSTIYFARRFSPIIANVRQLAELRKRRKDPQALLRSLGCEGADFAGIETALAKMLQTSVQIRTSPHPELGMDVDKPSDYELAQRLLRRTG